MLTFNPKTFCFCDAWEAYKPGVCRGHGLSLNGVERVGRALNNVLNVGRALNNVLNACVDYAC